MVNHSDLEATAVNGEHQISGQGSHQFDKTILNSEPESPASQGLTLAENIEIGQGRNFDSVNQALQTHRVTENPDLCDRQDHDNLHPVCSNEDLMGKVAATPKRERRQSHELVTHVLKAVRRDQEAESYGVPTAMPFMPPQQEHRQAEKESTSRGCAADELTSRDALKAINPSPARREEHASPDEGHEEQSDGFKEGDTDRGSGASPRRTCSPASPVSPTSPRLASHRKPRASQRLQRHAAYRSGYMPMKIQGQVLAGPGGSKARGSAGVREPSTLRKQQTYSSSPSPLSPGAMGRSPNRGCINLTTGVMHSEASPDLRSTIPIPAGSPHGRASKDAAVHSKQYEVRDVGVNTPEPRGRGGGRAPTAEPDRPPGGQGDRAQRASPPDLALYADSGTNLDVQMGSPGISLATQSLGTLREDTARHVQVSSLPQPGEATTLNSGTLATKGADIHTHRGHFIHEGAEQSPSSLGPAAENAKGPRGKANRQDASCPAPNPNELDGRSPEVVVIHQSVTADGHAGQAGATQLRTQVLDPRASPDSATRRSVQAVDTQEEDEVDDGEGEMRIERSVEMQIVEPGPTPKASQCSLPSTRPIVAIRATKPASRHLPLPRELLTFAPAPAPPAPLSREQAATGSRYAQRSKPKPERRQLLAEFLTQHKQNFYSVPGRGQARSLAKGSAQQSVDSRTLAKRRQVTHSRALLTDLSRLSGAGGSPSLSASAHHRRSSTRDAARWAREDGWAREVRKLQESMQNPLLYESTRTPLPPAGGEGYAGGRLHPSQSQPAQDQLGTAHITRRSTLISSLVLQDGKALKQLEERSTVKTASAGLRPRNMAASMQEKEHQQQTMFNPWSSVIGGQSKRYFRQKHQMVAQQIDAKRQPQQSQPPPASCHCGDQTPHNHASHAEDSTADFKARRTSYIAVKFYRPDAAQRDASVCSRCSGRVSGRAHSPGGGATPHSPDTAEFYDGRGSQQRLTSSGTACVAHAPRGKGGTLTKLRGQGSTRQPILAGVSEAASSSYCQRSRAGLRSPSSRGAGRSKARRAEHCQVSGELPLAESRLDILCHPGRLSPSTRQSPHTSYAKTRPRKPLIAAGPAVRSVHAMPDQDGGLQYGCVGIGLSRTGHAVGEEDPLADGGALGIHVGGGEGKDYEQAEGEHSTLVRGWGPGGGRGSEAPDSETSKGGGSCKPQSRSRAARQPAGAENFRVVLPEDKRYASGLRGQENLSPLTVGIRQEEQSDEESSRKDGGGAGAPDATPAPAGGARRQGGGAGMELRNNNTATEQRREEAGEEEFQQSVKELLDLERLITPAGELTVRGEVPPYVRHAHAPGSRLAGRLINSMRLKRQQRQGEMPEWDVDAVPHRQRPAEHFPQRKVQPIVNFVFHGASVPPQRSRAQAQAASSAQPPATASPKSASPRKHPPAHVIPTAAAEQGPLPAPENNYNYYSPRNRKPGSRSYRSPKSNANTTARPKLTEAGVNTQKMLNRFRKRHVEMKRNAHPHGKEKSSIELSSVASGYGAQMRSNYNHGNQLMPSKVQGTQANLGSLGGYLDTTLSQKKAEDRTVQGSCSHHSNEKVTIDSGAVYQDQPGIFQRLNSARGDGGSQASPQKEVDQLGHQTLARSPEPADRRQEAQTKETGNQVDVLLSNTKEKPDADASPGARAPPRLETPPAASPTPVAPEPHPEAGAKRDEAKPESAVQPQLLGLGAGTPPLGHSALSGALGQSTPERRSASPMMVSKGFQNVPNGNQR